MKSQPTKMWKNANHIFNKGHTIKIHFLKSHKMPQETKQSNVWMGKGNRFFFQERHPDGQ